MRSETRRSVSGKRKRGKRRSVGRSRDLKELCFLGCGSGRVSSSLLNRHKKRASARATAVSRPLHVAGGPAPEKDRNPIIFMSPAPSFIASSFSLSSLSTTPSQHSLSFSFFLSPLLTSIFPDISLVAASHFFSFFLIYVPLIYE